MTYEKSINVPNALWTEAECQELRETLSRLAQHMIATMDPRRRDRLWPADPVIFQTNALNVAHGACGTALFLHDVLGEIPAEVRNWLLAQPVDTSVYPPGLYSGIAGVAWSFVEMGMEERGLELLRLVPQSPLAFQAVDMSNGSAGWGLAALALHLRIGDPQLLTLACRAGDHLLATAEHDSDGTFWTDPEEGIVRLGFGLGGSGIALFLLYLWRVCGDDRYLKAARDSMEYEVAHAQTHGGALVWGSTTHVAEHRPYWLRGGAGVTAALIRFAKLLADDRYSELARSGAKGCDAFFSVAPHLFEGLASMGETLLDMFVATGEVRYLDAARQKALQTLLYRINSDQGASFPGRFLVRISHDYGVGGAGIGLYLNRVLQIGPRRFHDIVAGRPTLGLRTETAPIRQAAGVASLTAERELAGIV